MPSSNSTRLCSCNSWKLDKSHHNQSLPPKNLGQMTKECNDPYRHESSCPIVFFSEVTQRVSTFPTATLQTQPKSKPNPGQTPHNTILQSFLEGQSQWIDEPVISQWRSPSSKLLATLETVNQLYHKWRQTKSAPFDPFFDPLWLHSAVTLQESGLPWHNNNLNMPDEIDPR